MATHSFQKFSLALMLLASCSQEPSLTERIEQLAADHVGRSVDLSIAAPFAWDEVPVFGAYYPKPNACKLLKLSAWGCFRLDFPEPDDDSPSLMVFMHKGELSATALLPRCAIDVSLQGGLKAARGTAKFISSRGDATCRAGALRLAQE